MKISIIGIGLIGGSLGMALRSRGVASVCGFGRNRETLQAAVELGAIDTFSLEIEEAVQGAEIVFVATPINSVVEAARNAAPHMSEGSILTDVASIKASITNRVSDLVLPTIDFIGGHPMCGSERTGVNNASADLFENAFYFLTPTDKTRTESFQKLHSVIASLGANIISIEPEKHDEIVAIISHLPHLLAFNLVNFSKKEGREIENILDFAGGGFHDMTRIAASNPEMWSEIFKGNATSIAKVSERFWETFREALRLIEGESEEMLHLLDDASKTRKSLDLRKDLSVDEMRELRIEVLDRPGVISDISVSLGNLGINIEDIEITHGVIPQGGLIKLALADEKTAQRAARVLAERGYKLSIGSIYEEGPE